ncbi:MAG: hydantoinase B/oxoprolinase family protein [Gammaproteobacteria bacterium]|nr:hydantoinase B/oxoprolinase family protein [Gammaproteobacteria bacterium]
MNHNHLDAVTLEILWTRLVSVVDEAAATFVRTSFSTLVRDANDFAVVLTDAQGRSIAQSTQSIPSFISTMPATISHFIDTFGVDSMREGDAFVTNDPWLGSGHLNDGSLAMPIFRAGKLIAFAGVVSHLPDVGGRLRNPGNREIYEEGLQIPPMRLLHAGKPDESLITIIRRNVRVPDETMGDLWAQIACCQTLADDLNALLDDSDVELNALAEEIIGRTEQAMRSAISEVPDGVYSYAVENDGPKAFPGGIVRIQCAVTIDGDSLSVDYTGTSDQVDLAINTVPCYTFAYTAYALKAVFAPWIPNAHGAFVPLTVTAPLGSLLNPERPASTGSRAMMGHLLPPAVFGALAKVLPSKVQAAPGSPVSSVQLANVRGEHRYVLNTFIGAGQGADATADGVSAISFPSNLSNTNIEVLESLVPVEVTRREIRRDSGGAGTKRGGDGIHFEFVMRGEDPALASFMVNRLRSPASGLEGGQPGARAQFTINDEPADSAEQHVLTSGDSVVIQTGGGGGFGTG